MGQQLGAQAPAVPGVGDSDGELSGAGIGSVTDVAGDAQAAAAGGVQGGERLVVVVADVGVLAQLRLG